MSNKRQWYAIRSDLQKRGLWRYAEASATKKARVSRKRDTPAEDPEEGTSAGTAESQPPPAKLPSLESIVRTTVSNLAGPSAGALRVISTGAQVIGTLYGSQHMVVAATAGQAIAKLIETAAAGGAGATVEDSAATAAGQRSNAPNQEDTTSAPAPQLAETTDPVGNTRPEVPETEFEIGTTNSYLYDPLNSPDQLLQEIVTQIGAQDGDEMEWDSEELEELLNRLENQILNVRRLVVGGTYDKPPIRVSQESKHLKLNKLVPV